MVAQREPNATIGAGTSAAVMTIATAEEMTTVGGTREMAETDVETAREIVCGNAMVSVREIAMTAADGGESMTVTESTTVATAIGRIVTAATAIPETTARAGATGIAGGAPAATATVPATVIAITSAAAAIAHAVARPAKSVATTAVENTAADTPHLVAPGRIVAPVAPQTATAARRNAARIAIGTSP